MKTINNVTRKPNLEKGEQYELRLEFQNRQWYSYVGNTKKEAIRNYTKGFLSFRGFTTKEWNIVDSNGEIIK